MTKFIEILESGRVTYYSNGPIECVDLDEMLAVAETQLDGHSVSKLRARVMADMHGRQPACLSCGARTNADGALPCGH